MAPEENKESVSDVTPEMVEEALAAVPQPDHPPPSPPEPQEPADEPEPPASPPTPDAPPVAESHEQGDQAAPSLTKEEVALMIDDAIRVAREDLSKQIDDAFAALSEKIDGIDLEELRHLVEAAKASSAEAINERLDTIEKRIKFFV